MRRPCLCVDANLVVRLVADPRDKAVQRLWEQWDTEGQQLVAPALLGYEVANALYRYRRMGWMTASSVRLALKAALSLPLRLYEDAELHGRALDIAERFSLPAAYDAHYLALAQWLGGEFWTTDQRLAQTVQAEWPWVHLVAAAGGGNPR